MTNKITILFKEQPDDSRFIKGTYTKLGVSQAYKFIEDKIAVGYDPNTKSEFNPLLDEDTPAREILFENNIYTEEDLKKNIDKLIEIDGIGQKTHQKLKDLVIEDEHQVNLNFNTEE